jgi:hypothetical protein
VLGLVAVLASVLLQTPLTDHSEYREFVEAASRIGRGVLIVAVAVLAADLAAMIAYTLRRGHSDRPKNEVITENRPLSAVSLRSPPLVGWSKRKMLGGKSSFVTMRSLVDGSATFGERMMVLGIVTLFVSFFLVWVGAGLMLMKSVLILALIPVLPGLWVYYDLRDDWRHYQEAKKRVDARSREA